LIILYVIVIVRFVFKIFSNDANFIPTIFIYLENLLVKINTKYSLEW
jgi:hypothetical protein